MKYSKSAIGLLTAQYRSVLKKCWMINVGLFALGGALLTATPAEAVDIYVNSTGPLNSTGTVEVYHEGTGGNPGTYTATNVQLWSNVSQIGKFTLTGQNVIDALGDTPVKRAYADESGNNIKSTYATKTALNDYIMTATADNKYATKTALSNLVAGTDAFTKLKIGGATIQDSDEGPLSINKGLLLNGTGSALTIGGTSLSDGTLTLGGVDLVGNGGVLSTDYLRAGGLYVGATATTPMTGVDNSLNYTVAQESAHADKLVTSAAVHAAIETAKTSADSYTAATAAQSYFGSTAITKSGALDQLGEDMYKLKGTSAVSGSVANTVKVNAQDADFTKTSYAANTIGGAIKANADNINTLMNGTGTGSITKRIQDEAQNAAFTKTADGAAVGTQDALGATSNIKDAINKVAGATNANSAKLVGLKLADNTAASTVQEAIDSAKTAAMAYSYTGTPPTGVTNIYADADTVTKALTAAGNSTMANTASINLLNEDNVNKTGTIKNSIYNNADLAKHIKADDATVSTIHDSINANETAIKNLVGTGSGTVEERIAAQAQNGTFTEVHGTATADSIGAATIIKDALNNVANATDANTDKLTGLKLADGATTAATVQEAINSSRTGVANNILDFGGLASEVRVGKADGSAFTGLDVNNSTKAISLKSQGSSMTTGLDIANAGTIGLGVTAANVLHGIEISNNGNTVTFKGTGSTDVATITDGALTAKSATLGGLTLNGSSTVKVDKISSAAAITGTPDNDTLATTAAVKATVDTVSSALNDYATKAEVHGSADVTAVNLGEQAKTVNVGADAGVAISNDTAKSAELKVKTGEGKKTAVTVSANDIKIGNTNGDNFDGITYNSTNGVVIGSGANTVTAKAGALNASGNITSAATVKGANLEATAGLKIGSAEATSIDNAGTGASGSTAPTDGKALASTLTVWNAAEAAKTAATAYDPSASILTKKTVQEAIDEAAGLINTNKTKSEANETKLAGLTMYDGTTVANTVQAALTDFKTNSQQYTLDNIKTGAQNAKYDAGTYDPGTIGAAIKDNADKIAGLGDASKLGVATTMPADADHIGEWATTNAAKVANIGTTFGVFSMKLADVQADLMDGAQNVSSIANSLATAQQKTDDASLHDVIASIATEAGDAVYVAKTDLTPANGQVVLGKDSTAVTEKGTSFTVDTANSNVSAKVFKPAATGDLHTKEVSLEFSKDGLSISSSDDGAAAKTVTIADGVVSAEGLKLGANDVTSIDAGAALDITTDVADADKKVMATDAAVKATVKALAEGAVKDNTDAIALLNDADTKDGSVKNSIKTLADSATHGSTTIGEAIDSKADQSAVDTALKGKASIAKTSSIYEYEISNELTGDDAVSTLFYNKEGADKTFVQTSHNYSGRNSDITNGDSGISLYTENNEDQDITNRIELSSDDSGNGILLHADDVMHMTGTSEIRVMGSGAYYSKDSSFNPTKDEIVTVGTAENADYTNAAAYADGTIGKQIQTNANAIATLNDGKTVENSVDYKVYKNAKDALYKAGTGGAEDITIAQAIDNASQGASDALAKVLNGETKFNKAKIGNDWTIAENDSKRLTVRDIASNKPVMSLDKGMFSLNKIADDGSSNAYLVATGNSFTLSNSEGQYFNVSASGFNVGNKDDPSFTINPVNGNVKAKGTVVAAGLKVGSSEVMTGVDNGREALTENTASPKTLASAATVYTTVKANAEKATYTPATGEESAAVITAGANTINGAILALDENAVATNNAIGKIDNLHGNDNAMVNRGAGDVAGDPAANIVEALNNISASVGNVHGLATAAADGSLDRKYASQQKPADWYKNGAGNLFPGSATDDHLAELAASIGNRNYAADTPYLNANESVATSLVALANGLQGVADNYVTKEYFNGGTATTPATISMGANASDIVIGHVAEGAGAGTNIDVNHAAGTITNSVVTAGDAMSGTAPTTTTTELSANGFKVTHNGKTISVADDTITFNNGKVLKDEGDGAIWTNGDLLANGNISSGASIYSGANLGVAGEASIGTNLGVGGDTTLAGKLGFGGNTFESVAKTISDASTDAELPTAKAVYDVVHAETTVAAAPNGNYAEGSVKDALKTVDSRMGNVSWYKNSTHYANPSSTAGLSLSAAIRNIDANVYAKVGDVDFADTMNYVSSADTDLTTAIKSMDTNVKAAIDGLDDTYVTKAYFNNGDDTNNAISMGSGAKDITIGSATNNVVVDNANHTIGATIDTRDADEVLSTLTMDNTNGVKLATTKGLGSVAKTKNVAINNGVVTADDSFVASDTAEGTSSTIKSDGSATFVGANKTASITDGDITADDINAATVTATTITGTTVNATTLAMVAGGEATAIDNAGTVMTAAPTDDGKTLASTLTVYNNIHDATTVAAATNGNYAAGSVKDALKTVDRNMGNLSWYNGTHYANTGSTKTSLAAAIKNMDTNVFTAVGDVDLYLPTATNYANTTATPATNLTQAIVNMDANVKQAIDDLDDTYVTQDYFNGEDGAAGSAVIMGRSSNDIEIGKQEFDTSGPIKLKSGIKITNGTANTIEIGNYTDDDFYGIQVSNGGKSVTVAGLNKDVTIVDGDITTAGKVQATKLELSDGASTPTITEATAIDNAGTVMTAAPADGKTLASTLTVYNNVQDATVFKAAEVTANTHNYAAGDTVKQAIASLDGVVGDIESYRGTKYANTSSTEDVDLAHAVINLDTAIFNVTKDYVTKTYFDGGDDTNHYISMGSLAKKVTIGADNSARIVLDVEDAAKKSITMTAGTDMQVAVNGTEITIGDKDGQGIKVDNDGLTTTFAGSTTAKKVVVEEGVVTASDGVVVGDKTGTAYAEIEDDTATFKGANGTVTIADGTVTAKKFAFSDTAYATGIDNTGGVFTAAPADNYTIATTKTVYDNTYLTSAATNGNYAAGSLLNAVKSIDTYMGNLSWYNGTHYANTGSTKTSLAAAIKNMDTNVFAKVGTVDLSGATNYANTTATPADNLTEAVVNIDSNVKKAIDDLDGKFVTKAYFSGGEQDTTSPNAGRIIMGDTANKITIGRTATSADVTNLTNGIEIDATTGNVVMGKQSITNNVASLEAGVKVSADTGTVEIVSVDTTQNSTNGVSVDKDIVKIGTTSNGKFEGISIQDGYVANVNKDDATKSAAFASDGFSVKDGDKLATMGADGFASVNGDKSATVGYNGIAVENGSKIATVAADGFAAKDGSNVATMNSAGFAATDGTKLTTVAADGVAAKNGDDLATMNSTGFAVTDSDNTATLGAKGLAVEDENHNGTYVGATGMSVTDGADTTTIAAGSVTTKEVITDKLTLAGNSATAIDQGTALDPKATITDADKTTLASNATVKASINGIVADIEKQIHGDPNDPTFDVTIGEFADNTIIGKVSTDTAKPLNTDINVDTKNNKITLETKDISTDKQTSTGIELDNKNQTIGITSANGKLGTETGLKITNEGADDQHLIELTYTHKGQDDKVDTERGLVMDADNQTYSLGSTDVAGKTFSGLNMDAAGNTYALGKGTVDDQGKLTLDYGMTMDAEHGVTTFADKDGNGVTMNKGDMTVTDSATVGSVDATSGALTGVKLDKDGNAQASASATVGQVKADGSLDGNGVQMKNDGSAKFSATEGAVTVEKGGVIADNNVTVGDKSGANYIDMAKQTDGSYKATFASADGNVEIAGGSITADNKVTADEIEAKTRFYVGNPAGAVTAMYQTGIVSKIDEDNQSTYGATGLWTKKKTDEGTFTADLGGTGLSVTDGTAAAGVSNTGLWANDGNGKSASYSNNGIWMADAAATATKTASYGLGGTELIDGNSKANYGIGGLFVTNGTDSSSVGPSGIHTTKDMYAEGAVNGKDLVARESFTLAGTTVHAIDDSNAKINDFSGAGHDVDTLATTSSIYYNAEDSLYTPQQGTYTTVDATTINEALTAVDNIIGNFPDGLNYDNHNLDNGGQAKPENIVDAFNNIDATLGQIHGLAAKVGVENGSMNLGQNTTVEEHLTALAGSIGNRTSYTEENVIKNNESTAKSLDALDMAVGDISKLQGTTYASADNLSDAVVQIDDKLQNLDGRMERAEKDLKDVHHELRRGMASMAAMSALVPNSRSTGKTSLSLGTGAYSGHNAVAVGGFHYLTDNLMLNAGAAWSNSRDAVYRVGVTYSF